MIQSKIAKASRSLSKEVNALSFGEPTSFCIQSIGLCMGDSSAVFGTRRRGERKRWFFGDESGSVWNGSDGGAFWRNSRGSGLDGFVRGGG